MFCDTVPLDRVPLEVAVNEVPTLLLAAPKSVWFPEVMMVYETPLVMVVVLAVPEGAILNLNEPLSIRNCAAGFDRS